MPIYTFVCDDCVHVRYVSCRMDARDDPRECETCSGALRRKVEAGHGLLAGRRSPVPTQRTSSDQLPTSDPEFSRPLVPGISITDCATGIVVDGGSARISGVRMMDTPTAFELKNGARIHVSDVSQEFSSAGSAKPPRRPRRVNRRKPD